MGSVSEQVLSESIMENISSAMKILSSKSMEDLVVVGIIRNKEDAASIKTNSHEHEDTLSLSDKEQPVRVRIVIPRSQEKELEKMSLGSVETGFTETQRENSIIEKIENKSMDLKRDFVRINARSLTPPADGVLRYEADPIICRHCNPSPDSIREITTGNAKHVPQRLKPATISPNRASLEVSPESLSNPEGKHLLMNSKFTQTDNTDLGRKSLHDLSFSCRSNDTRLSVDQHPLPLRDSYVRKSHAESQNLCVGSDLQLSQCSREDRKTAASSPKDGRDCNYACAQRIRKELYSSGSEEMRATESVVYSNSNTITFGNDKYSRDSTLRKVKHVSDPDHGSLAKDLINRIVDLKRMFPMYSEFVLNIVSKSQEQVAEDFERRADSVEPGNTDHINNVEGLKHEARGTKENRICSIDGKNFSLSEFHMVQSELEKITDEVQARFARNVESRLCNVPLRRSKHETEYQSCNNKKYRNEIIQTSFTNLSPRRMHKRGGVNLQRRMYERKTSSVEDVMETNIFTGGHVGREHRNMHNQEPDTNKTSKQLAKVYAQDPDGQISNDNSRRKCPNQFIHLGCTKCRNCVSKPKSLHSKIHKSINEKRSMVSSSEEDKTLHYRSKAMVRNTGELVWHNRHTQGNNTNHDCKVGNFRTGPDTLGMTDVDDKHLEILFEKSDKIPLVKNKPPLLVQRKEQEVHERDGAYLVSKLDTNLYSHANSDKQREIPDLPDEHQQVRESLTVIRQQVRDIVFICRSWLQNAAFLRRKVPSAFFAHAAYHHCVEELKNSVLLTVRNMFHEEGRGEHKNVFRNHDQRSFGKNLSPSMSHGSPEKASDRTIYSEDQELNTYNSSTYLSRTVHKQRTNVCEVKKEWYDNYFDGDSIARKSKRDAIINKGSEVTRETKAKKQHDEEDYIVDKNMHMSNKTAQQRYTITAGEDEAKNQYSRGCKTSSNRKLKTLRKAIFSGCQETKRVATMACINVQSVTRNAKKLIMGKKNREPEAGKSKKPQDVAQERTSKPENIKQPLLISLKPKVSSEGNGNRFKPSIDEHRPGRQRKIVHNRPPSCETNAHGVNIFIVSDDTKKSKSELQELKSLKGDVELIEVNTRSRPGNLKTQITKFPISEDAFIEVYN